MAAQDEETGLGMSNEQLRDEVMTLFLAGQETTSNHLSWTLFLLSQHTVVRQAIHDEVKAELGDRVPTMNDVRRLVFVRRVIDESLRMFPAGWMAGRKAVESDQIVGHSVPAGSIVMMSPYVVHRHPDFWESPERFDPDRFSPERAEGRHRFAYWPFGGGPRLCVGQEFAILESTLALSMIHQRFEVHVREDDVEPLPSLTLRPKRAMVATLTSKH